jgi:hypothetical protein
MEGETTSENGAWRLCKGKSSVTPWGTRGSSTVSRDQGL